MATDDDETKWKGTRRGIWVSRVNTDRGGGVLERFTYGAPDATTVNRPDYTLFDSPVAFTQLLCCASVLFLRRCDQTRPYKS